MKQDLYTIQEASSLLGISPKTLRRWEETGKVKPIRTFGNQRRYSGGDIKKLERLINLRKARQEVIQERKAAMSAPVQNILSEQFVQTPSINSQVDSEPVFPIMSSQLIRFQSNSIFCINNH